MLVNRGWIAQQASRSTLPDARPPVGEVTVRGRISIPRSGYLELKPDTNHGSIRQNLDPARFAAATGLAALPAVVEASAATAADDGLVRAWPAPDFGVETHRIYMVQWYLFARRRRALALVQSTARAAAPTMADERCRPSRRAIAGTRRHDRHCS